MIRLYTKKGDHGTTQTLQRKNVPKDDLQVRVLGVVDECNAQIGVLCSFLPLENDVFESTRFEIQRIQRCLFGIGHWIGNYRGAGTLVGVSAEDIAFLEGRIDWYSSQCAELRSFVLPGGAPTASLAHVCRADVRRMERVIVSWCGETDQSAQHVMCFVNRLSDYFFALARYLNKALDQPERLWP